MTEATVPTSIPHSFSAAQLYSPEVIANPYPYYAALRDEPIQFGLEDYPPGTVPGQDKPYPAWAVLKYEDVTAVARNHEVFSSRDIMQEESDAPTLMLVNHDPPRHTTLRQIARKAFIPRRVETDVRPWLAKTVDAMFAEVGEGEVDFMENLAPDLPARFMTKFIGTPEADYELLRRWANAFMVTSDFTLEERNQCNEDLAAYYTDAVLERYRDLERGVELPDDLMSAFMLAEDEGNKLTQEEVIRFCITLVVAGAETTAYLLGNLVCTLVEEPHFFSLLKEDRKQIRPFIDESLRRDGPIQRLFRVAMADCEVGGAPIKEGDWVGVFFASANRDPSVWEEPDRFILNRPNISRQLTFSYGIHHCLGTGVARMEAELMVNGLLDRYSSVGPGSRPMKRQSGGLLNYGLEECPIRLQA